LITKLFCEWWHERINSYGDTHTQSWGNSPSNGMHMCSGTTKRKASLAREFLRLGGSILVVVAVIIIVVLVVVVVAIVTVGRSMQSRKSTTTDTHYGGMKFSSSLTSSPTPNLVSCTPSLKRTSPSQPFFLEIATTSGCGDRDHRLDRLRNFCVSSCRTM
jgi:hypothetical protein